MGNPFVTWDGSALDLLEQRDRFTRQAIRDEFTQDPTTKAVQFDSAEGGFVTPVADDRYSVVWYRDAANQTAVVRAVVPWTRFGGLSGEDLKIQLAKVVQQESKGKVVIK
jgi:hypothetical protein